VLLFAGPLFAETVIERYPNGNIHWEKNVDNKQLPHGSAKEYNKQGILIAERNYYHGVLEGLIKLYYPSGELKTQFIYKNDKRHGISLGYYKNGTLKDRGRYQEDKLDGVIRKYNSDGSLKAELIFKNDRQEGTSKIFFPSGEIQHLYTYRKGLLLERQTFDQKGNLLRHQHYTPSRIQP
jgi:antitoxin component YwqK of YwqJK toxin-antitoxin module